MGQFIGRAPYDNAAWIRLAKSMMKPLQKLRDAGRYERASMRSISPRANTAIGRRPRMIVIFKDTTAIG